jgi:glyoxylase I family protein
MATAWFSHVALNCRDPLVVERFYTRHFGFRRARVVPLPDGSQIVFIKAGFVYLELFPAEGERPVLPPTADGYHFPGTRHLAFQVDDVDAAVAALTADGRTVTLGPLDFGGFIPGWKTAWVADPEGNIVEVSQGFVDQPTPPPLPTP